MFNFCLRLTMTLGGLLSLISNAEAAQTFAPAGTLLSVTHNYTWERMTTDNVSSGQVVPFAAYQFNTIGAPAGNYTFTMTTLGFGGAINVYTNSFDPTNPSTNFFANGVVTNVGGKISQTLNLPANSSFEVVFSMVRPGLIGTFGATVSGPGNVNITTQTTVSVRVNPKSQTVNAGASVALHVYALGTLPHTWQWYQGAKGNTSTPVAGATSPNYTNPALLISDSYWVRVVGPSGAGSADSSAAVITVAGNDNASFSGALAPGGCTTANGDLYAVQRFQIQSSGNYAFNVSPGFSLTTYEGVFDPLHPLQNLWGVTNGFYAVGTYDLVVSKASPGGAFSGAIGAGPAAVNLLPGLPPQFLSSPPDTTILPGTTATLSASTTCGTPFTLQWYRGNSGDISNPISGANGPSYTTPVLSRGASYWVRMNYAGGNSDSATATVFVTSGPISDSGVLTACDRTFNHPSAPGTLSGQNCFYKTFVFRVSSSGNYTFSVQTPDFQGTAFLYQGIFVPSNPLLNFYALATSGSPVVLAANGLQSGPTPYYLVISSATSGKTGSYTVTATAGPALVTQTRVPVISTQPASTNIYRNESTILTVASPSSGVSYQWYMGSSCGDKAPIPGANSNAYTTGPLTATQHYWVELTTPGGYLFSAEAIVGIIPKILQVTSGAADGAYGAGQVLPITVTFDQDVDVTGTPRLSLNSGGVAPYGNGSGTATLTFAYFVGAGQSSSHLDCTSSSALSLSGGTIQTVGVPADLTLPAGVVAEALGGSKNIIIDTTPPSLSIGAPSASATAAGPVTYTASYTDDHFGTSTLSVSDITMNATGTASGTVSVSGAGTARTVTLSGITGYGTLGISIAAGTATDTAGNHAPAAGPSGTFAVRNPTGPPNLTQLTWQSDGSFQFAFTNAPGLAFTVIGTTNLGLSMSSWSVIGSPVEGPAGQYQFNNSGAKSNTMRFYRVSFP